MLLPQVYHDAAQGLVVLQQRSPVIAGCQRQFAGDLVDWIKQQKFSQARLGF